MLFENSKSMQLPTQLPTLVDERGTNGLHVVAVDFAITPMSTLSLSVPFAPCDGVELARSEVFAAWLDCYLSQHLYDIGASVKVGRQGKWLTVAVSAPERHTVRVLSVVAQSLTDIDVAQPDLARAISLVTQQTAAMTRHPFAESNSALLKHLYRHVPAVLMPVPDMPLVARATGEDVRDHGSRSLRMDEAHLVLASGGDPSRLCEQVTRFFDHVPGAPEAKQPPGCPVIEPAPIKQLERAWWGQSHIRLAAPGVAVDARNKLAVSIANGIFGGYFSSRLNQAIREREGLVYRVQSQLGEHADQPVIVVGAEAGAHQVDATLERITAHLRDMTRQPVTGAEVDRLRNYMVGSTLIGMASQAGVVATLTASLMYGEPVTRIASLADDLHGVTAADVRAAAAEYFTPERFTGIVMGPTQGTQA